MAVIRAAGGICNWGGGGECGLLGKSAVGELGCSEVGAGEIAVMASGISGDCASRRGAEGAIEDGAPEHGEAGEGFVGRAVACQWKEAWIAVGEVIGEGDV